MRKAIRITGKTWIVATILEMIMLVVLGVLYLTLVNGVWWWYALAPRWLRYLLVLFRLI